MPLTHRSTPCVGICSTTYGDLVCRGCKRFAHEIVGWNGFAPAQREAVWQRLRLLRDGSVADFLRVVDAEAVRSRAEELRVPDIPDLSDLQVAYEVLVRSTVSVPELAAVGIVVQPGRKENMTARELVQVIDNEFFGRSRAHYERNYRIAAQ